PESGISDCQFALGSAEGEDNIFSWTPVTFGSGPQETAGFYAADLPVPEGQEVVLTVRSVNRAGIASDAAVSRTIAYGDTTPPEAASVSMIPQRYTSEPGYLQIGWAPVRDPESGIVSYEYAVGTSPDEQDVLSWTGVELNQEPYLLGFEKVKAGGTGRSDGSGQAGGTGQAGDDRPGGSQWIKGASGQDLLYASLISEGGLRSTYVVEPEGLQLEHGVTYYAFVRVTNGSGLTAEAAAGSLTVDTTPPKIMSPTVKQGRDRSAGQILEFTAGDSESGIKAYRTGPQWIDLSGAASVRISIPLDTPYPPALQVWVMNGAGLTQRSVLEVNP
ncbi:MAG: hypothetical protein ACP5IA_12315, partial [Sediminispirochaetaceae bacterium]